MSGDVENFYQNRYKGKAVYALRRYPHEEMMRFIGRHFLKFRPDDEFFTFDRSDRSSISILEIGCGAGSNLWAIAKEGFSAYGIDISSEALNHCRQMLSMWNTAAQLELGDMRQLPYADKFFDGVVDIYASCCLMQKDFDAFLAEVARVLKPGGKFYSWNPSARSQAFIDHAPADLIEPFTLSGILRPSSPFFGNNYPFRFLTPETATQSLSRAGLAVLGIEATGRSCRGVDEYFEWLSVTAQKQPVGVAQLV